MLPGSLAARLAQWAELQSIPDSLRGAIKTADMTSRIELAMMLADAEVEQLGLDAALKLVNAPARQNSQIYWRECASAILAYHPMPFPPVAPTKIVNDGDLEYTETSIACADVYLWLSRRPEFGGYAPEEAEVREIRGMWSAEIDAALLRKLDMTRRCPECGRLLPANHPHRLCDHCFFERRRARIVGYE
jgi:hypothetical protein